MPRPKNPRNLQFQPGVTYYKPRGVPLSTLTEVVLASDELEALKLYEVDNLDQTTAAGKMQISQPTFARILASATKKIAEAIIKGMAIRIEQKT
jgi:predicted DNA-binding protein (UPF0251 family)